MALFDKYRLNHIEKRNFKHSELLDEVLDMSLNNDALIERKLKIYDGYYDHDLLETEIIEEYENYSTSELKEILKDFKKEIKNKKEVKSENK